MSLLHHTNVLTPHMITTTLHVISSQLYLAGDYKEILETYQPMATDFMGNLYVLSLCNICILGIGSLISLVSRSHLSWGGDYSLTCYS